MFLLNWKKNLDISNNKTRIESSRCYYFNIILQSTNVSRDHQYEIVVNNVSLLVVSRQHGNPSMKTSGLTYKAMFDDMEPDVGDWRVLNQNKCTAEHVG